MQLSKPDPMVLIDGTAGDDNNDIPTQPRNLVGTGVTDRMRGSAPCSRSRCNVRLRGHRTAGLAIMGRFVRGGYWTAAI